jgi:SAM-dependent methyltransferase
MNKLNNLTKLYNLRFSSKNRKAKNRVWEVIIRHFIQYWIKPDFTVLDLGCGQGEFLNNIFCFRRIGVDLNPDNLKYLQPGIEFHCHSVTELSFLDDQSIDVVFTSNLMEHLLSKNDVISMLLEAKRVMKPYGKLLAIGPNINKLNGSYWNFWDHHIPITEKSLCEALTMLGYTIEKCVPAFLPFTTCSNLPKWSFLVWLYIKVPFLWSFMGKQFFIVAIKDRHD